VDPKEVEDVFAHSMLALATHSRYGAQLEVFAKTGHNISEMAARRPWCVSDLPAADISSTQGGSIG